MSSYGGRGPMLNAVLFTETAVASIFVALRIYSRKVLLNTLGWDDLLLVFVVLFLGLYSALLAAGTTYGIGQKRADVLESDYPQAMKYEIIGQAVCIFNIAISRAAVAFFLLRIVVQKWHKMAIWFCIVTTTILATICTIGVLVQCIPIQAVWDNSVNGNCWLDFTSLGLTTSAYAVCIDFILALAPLAIIWDLKLKRKDKILTIAGLSLGVFAGICGIMRTSALTSMKSFDEYIYDTVDMLIYSGTENFVGAICASVPVLRPVYVKIRHGYTTSDDSGQRSYHLSDYDSRNAERSLGGRSKDGLETRIYSHGRDGPTGLADNGSEETILRETSGKQDGFGDVVLRTEIRVDYSQEEPVNRTMV